MNVEELAKQAGLVSTWGGWVSTHQKHAEGVSDEFLERFAELVRQDEREACAKLCLEQDEYGCGQYAKAIRARSKHD
jgi:glycerol-3-phosphate dehydrogenase